MEQTWAVVSALSNARITEDISGLERVRDKIIEAKGCIVPDENFLTGRCARKIHGEGGRKTKLRKRDRKSTHLLDLPVHPALMGAYEDLLGWGLRDTGRRRRGPSAVLAEFKILGWGGTQEAISSWSSLPK